jgi:predicted ATP-binding protein involved in virulence
MEKIELINYRCFEHLELSFASGVTLLVGDNASGKTTLIRAIGACLNSFFSGFSDENTRFFGLQKGDFRIVMDGDQLAGDLPIEVKFTLLDKNVSLILRSKKGRTLQKPLEPISSYGSYLQQVMVTRERPKLSLPLFAAFSTSDIHAVRKLSYEPFNRDFHKRSFGYYECLQGDGLLDYWTQRLLVLREGEIGDMEVQGVIQALILMLGKDGCGILHDIKVRPRQGKVDYHLIDGRVTNTENLSDGFRRLVNIGMDLAFRCMLLNMRIYGSEACSKTEGTVLIDEIDLHLHPTLQSLIIPSLRMAFPKLQFIITSHAPMVMSGIPQNEGNNIIQLRHSPKEGYTQKEISAYGLDASTIIESVLGVITRYKVVDDQLTTLFDLIDSDQFAAARAFLAAMRKEFGERLPELARAESMLNFLKPDE